MATVYKRIKEHEKTVSEKYMQPIRIMKIADTRAIQFDVMGKEAYEATVLFKHLYYYSLIHLKFFFFFFFGKSISRDKIVLLVFNTLEESLKIPATVTILSSF